MPADPAPKVIGLIAASVHEFFKPDQDLPPTGGGTDDINLMAGEAAIPPVWIDDHGCSDCTEPYIWVRISGRFRTTVFPAPADRANCGTRRAMTVEVGIARCAPFDRAPEPDKLEQQAMVQWDDAHRLDLALCKAMQRAEAVQAATDSTIGAGEPYGPEGLLIAWLQTVTVQF
ncbi:hypothetical protein [Rhodococcus koreensis]